MEWICQFGDVIPRPAVSFAIVKVGAFTRDVATQVHLSSIAGPAAEVRLMAMVAFESTFWSTSVAPHLALICGQATRASSVLWFWEPKSGCKMFYSAALTPVVLL